jgi:hypothetical protein
LEYTVCIPGRKSRGPQTWGLLAILVGVLAALPVAPANAQAVLAIRSPQYHLVSLDGALPPGFLFFDAVGITDDRSVYGTGTRDEDGGFLPAVMVYRAGKETVLHDGVTYVVNTSGVVGGAVVDPATGAEQAAIFTGSRARVIPRLPGETTSHVIGLTGSGTALVFSANDATLTSAFYLDDVRGKVTPVDFGPGVISDLSVNDDLVIAGTIKKKLPGPLRAFRYDVGSTGMTVLDPIRGDPQSEGQGINRRGDVLGYSYTGGGLERIGVWRGKTFQTYFTEGTAEFPTVSNTLLWNRDGLIVITGGHVDLNSYLVPRPGVRMKLADLSDALPAWTSIRGINSRGDLIGFGGSTQNNVDTNFLLERIR